MIYNLMPPTRFYDFNLMSKFGARPGGDFFFLDRIAKPNQNQSKVSLGFFNNQISENTDDTKSADIFQKSFRRNSNIIRLI